MANNKYVSSGIILAILIGAVFLTPWIIKLFSPFLISFLLSIPMQKPIKFLEKKFKIKKGISSAFSVIFVLISVFTLIYFAIYKIFIEIVCLFGRMPENIDYISRHINVFIQKYFQFYDDLTPNFKKKLDIILTNFNKDTSNLITSFAKHIINFSGNFVSRLPSILLFVFILSLSSFFFIKDYDLIMRFFTNNLPRKFLEKFILIKKSLLDIILKYLKAVLILMLLAICEITVALWILRVDYALTIGVLAGLVDVLPILGTAVVLLPIALTNLINGNYYIASSILIVQIVCFTVKQILEPKIISNQIGVHPLVAIISIYVGAELFGAKGVILGPVISFLTINSISTYYKNINLNQIT